ncbi:hypothetical protein OG897_06180 [Streptomyces sp. NBC_00237]|uniref:hypothetical protein n=1 Tax=Streptomyces sp. NBC_00237 TaxID=2975687 RepID=UPI0022566000|nr:hypothetical protein [Streptomyces sp. NBC_00237]MCX5201049.1 hypothetical protein [Streptomyces sp. NBC_00237]
MATIKRCSEPFAAEVGGITRVIAAGELISTDDAIYNRDTRAHFEDVATHVDRQAERRASGASVELATAEPGEPRSLTPPAEDSTVEEDADESPVEEESSESAPRRRTRRTRG